MDFFSVHPNKTASSVWRRVGASPSRPPVASELPDTLEDAATAAPRRAPAATPPEPSAPARALHATVIRPVMALGGAVMELGLRRHGFANTMVATPYGAVHMWDAPGMNPNGPTVVFFHGLATFASEYAPFLTHLLKTSARVIAVDLPGAGRSFKFTSAPQQDGIHQYSEVAVRAVCYAVPKVVQGPLVVAGHSLGGYFAVRVTLDPIIGPHVAHVILVSPDGAPWSDASLADARNTMHVCHYRDALATARRNWENKPLLTRMMAPFIWARFAESKVRNMVDSDMFEPVLQAEQIAALPARTLLIVGAQEHEYEATGRLAYYEENLPAGYILARPDVAHGDITNAPAALMDLITDYAAGK